MVAKRIRKLRSYFTRVGGDAGGGVAEGEALSGEEEDLAVSGDEDGREGEGEGEVVEVEAGKGAPDNVFKKDSSVLDCEEEEGG